MFSFAPSTGALHVHVNFANASVGRGFSVLTNVSGTLYGTTTYGAAGNYGALFAFDPLSDVTTLLHAFTPTDGTNAASGVIEVNGTLYGTATNGGANNVGSLFSYVLSSETFSTFYNFQGGGTGAYPVAQLTYADGALFGSTSGFRNLVATLYTVNLATNAQSVVHTFPKSEGLYSAMTVVGDILYGTIQDGSPKYGELFRFDPATQQFTAIYKFKGGTDGGNPSSSLLSVGPYLYGTTPSITTANGGTVFRIHR